MGSRYELLGLIARGGMAEVHLARTHSEGGFTKLLALKRILETYADNPQLTAMFMDEARLAARLSHPNVVQVFDFGKDDDGYYIAMEYVPGPDLANVLRTLRHAGERPPEAPMVEVLIQVLRGLDHAHRLTGADGLNAGVVHRDVSPGNVLLTADGVAKLSDFGVARAAERLSESTRAGKTKGKAAYMSPEQARSRPLDARSDVFAAGLLLWEVLAGQRLYQANDDATLIRMAAKAELRTLQSVNLEVDPELQQILDRALQLEPEKRFPSASAMAQALEAYHRAHYPRYTPSALGEVVQRSLEVLPPLPHLAIAGGAPAAPEQPRTSEREDAPAPEERPSRPSVRRPKAQAELAPRTQSRQNAEVPAAKTAPEPAQAPPQQPSSGWGSLAATAAVIAVAVAGGLLWYDHQRELEVPVVNGPPQAMQRLAQSEGDKPPTADATQAKPQQAPAAVPVPTPAPSPTPAPTPTPAPHEKRHPRSSSGVGYLSVRCDPWCDIHIDGKPTDFRSPAEKIPLPAGTHTLRLVNPTVHLEKHTTVTIKSDETLNRYFNLVLDR